MMSNCKSRSTFIGQVLSLPTNTRYLRRQEGEEPNRILSAGYSPSLRIPDQQATIFLADRPSRYTTQGNSAVDTLFDSQQRTWGKWRLDWPVDRPLQPRYRPCRRCGQWP